MALAQTLIGNPLNEKVRMGSLAGQDQRKEVKQQVQKLLASSQIIYGSLDSVELVDADIRKGAFMSPLLLENEKPFSDEGPHDIEAFGPVSTLMPYKNLDEAILLSKKGKGSLCSTIVTSKDLIAKDYVVGAATHHGRILVLNRHDCKRKYRSWISASHACSWWSGPGRRRRGNGWYPRCETLYAKSCDTGFTG